MPPFTEASRRRGVLLLVVLSVLTLFLLLGTTYVIMASRARATAKAFRNFAESQAQPATTWRPLLRDAALQVIRGPSSLSGSVLQGHDLLGDKYGGSQNYFVASTSLVANGQLLVLSIVTAEPPLSFCGRVIHIQDGGPEIAGSSHRIVQAAPGPPGQVRIYMLQPPDVAAASVSSIRTARINGRDFAGSGFGQTTGGPQTTDLSDRALVPNSRLDFWTPGLSPQNGGNEDYDAIDEQNLALASTDGAIASFQRPAIIKHWVEAYASIKSLSTDAAERQLFEMLRGTSGPADGIDAWHMTRMRQAVLRPFAFDHTEDTSKNYDFTGRPLDSLNAALYGNDVDTDGDGIRDSIWLDLGSEPVLMPDGTRVKPLYAIRCLDLQGRINLNVHGSPVHPLVTPGNDSALAKRRTASREQPELSSEKTSQLPLGQGFGAADVRLDAVLGRGVSQAALVGLGNTQGSVSGMMRSVGAVFGRYGDEVGGGNLLPRPGMPGRNDFRETVSRQKIDQKLWRGPRLAEDFDYWQARSIFGGTPPDFWSRFSIGMDHRGHPLVINRLPNMNLQEMVDNPYEFDPDQNRNPHGAVVASANAWIDQPFTPAEFEALLRPFDADNASALPQRMLGMMMAAADGSETDFAYLRNAVTALSWDTPLVIVSGPDAPSWDPERHDWDLVRGLKMDLNRPFGDGKDNDNNGVVDDVSERNWAPRDTPNNQPPPGADDYAVELYDNEGTVAGWHLTRGLDFDDLEQPGPEVATLRARQLFAYHMFNLLKTLSDSYGFLYPQPGPDAEMNDPGSRLFAIKADDPDETDDERRTQPEAIDAALASDVQKQKDHTERVLAQWAINIVDFLDADAIMTPFRYKRLSEATGPAARQATQHVVWGCEYPDLMITETLAFHDRGIADTDQDDGLGTTMDDPDRPDPDADQARLPRGSLFVELHATRNPNTPNPPAELFTPQGLLDVGRTAPMNDLGFAAPVWRLTIARRDGSGGSHNNDPFQLLAKYPDTEWLLPHGGPEIGGDTAVVKPGPDQLAAITPDRYIWLSRQRPPADGEVDGQSGYPDRENTFYVRSGPSPVVARGGYLVIGPRRTTPLGSLAVEPDANVEDDEPQQQYGLPSPQRIDLQGGTVNVFSLAGRASSAPASTVVVAADPPAGWNPDHLGVGTDGIGLSISEPLRDRYYSEPTEQNQETGIYDLFGQNSLPDRPFDEESSGVLRGRAPEEGTVSNFATVILERLADPLRPHDPRVEIEKDGVTVRNEAWNPYIPLDFQPVDLTVFRGESGSAGEFRFYTRQRGFGSELGEFVNDVPLKTGWEADDQGRPPKPVRNPNPWKPLGSLDDLQIRTVYPKPTEPNRDTEVQAHFTHELNQLSRGTMPPPSGRDDPWANTPSHSLGSLNSSYGRPLIPGRDQVPESYAGAPDKPFPSIAWNDRPFANPYELLLVPRTAPSRIFTNFRPLDLSDLPDAVTQGEGPYQTAIVPTDIFGAQTPGAHLFPLTSLTDRPVAGGRYSRNADVFGRIFEFVRVPCPFACATVAIDPDGWTADRNDPTLFFKAPFNRVPLYVEPGGVNLNTIPRGTPGTSSERAFNEIGELVWAAVRGTVMLPDGSVETPRFLAPDGGSPPGSSLSLSEARTLPAPADSISLPFRSIRGRRHNLTNGSAAANTFLPNDLVAPFVSTLDGELAPRNFSIFGDAFSANASLFNPVLHPDDDSSASDPSRDPRLHTWFAFQPLIRAASATTVRSETYAIWVTMGLFEVQPSPAYRWSFADPRTGLAAAPGFRSIAQGSRTSNPLYPDGYQLVREYGGDTGQITRYRAFYLYDRSIPVGYQPGADTDVRRGIRLERFIE